MQQVWEREVMSNSMAWGHVKRRLDSGVYDKMHDYYRAFFDSVSDVNLQTLCAEGVESLSETVDSLPKLLSDWTLQISNQLESETDPIMWEEEQKELESIGHVSQAVSGYMSNIGHHLK